MKKYIQHDFLKISHFSASEWSHPLHDHNHFEIIFVHRGKGSHCLSGVHYPYSANSLFLLAPADVHRFVIEEETEFTFLKFTNAYFKSIGNIPLQNAWNQDIDKLFIYAARQESFTPKTPRAAEKTARLISLIVDEWQENRSENSEAVFLLIRTLLLFLKADLCTHILKPSDQHTTKITQILHYLHENIYSIELTRIDHLADKFGYSRHYLGLFFKEHTGTTLRDYINQYKLHLITNRLTYSSFSIKEISNELGFTDLSHFNKFFKKHKGINPTNFRKLNAAIKSAAVLEM